LNGKRNLRNYLENGKGGRDLIRRTLLPFLLLRRRITFTSLKLMQEGRKVIQLPKVNPRRNNHNMICGVLRRALRTNNEKGPWNKLFNLQMLCHKISHCKLKYSRPKFG
jgi:hypothetical protein